MKIGSFAPTGPYVVEAVIPRGNNSLVFKCQAVLDYADFDRLVPLPQPPMITYSDGNSRLDYEDAKYKEKSALWSKYRLGFIVTRSLSATEGLVWEYVDLGNPETWPKFEDEFRGLFMTDTEIRYIVKCVMEANSLDEDKLDEARKSFLAGRRQQ